MGKRCNMKLNVYECKGALKYSLWYLFSNKGAKRKQIVRDKVQRGQKGERAKQGRAVI